jgi:hypothetical protein
MGSESHDFLERAALRHVPIGARVVGPGFMPRRLAREHCCRATGLDHLPAALVSARSLASGRRPDSEPRAWFCASPTVRSGKLRRRHVVRVGRLGGNPESGQLADTSKPANRT